MRASIAAAAAIALGGGCGAPTSMLMSISVSGAPAPDSLRVTLFAAGRLGAQTVPLAAAGKTLPGTLEVAPLDAGAPDFRWLVDGLDPLGVVTSQAAASLHLAPMRQNAADVKLGPKLADSDGDGVPDVIDDCPLTPDPEQRCALPGDLGVPDGGAPCPAGAILCDDFESGSFATHGWTIGSLASGDVVALDGVKPHSGALAMHGSGTSLSMSHHAAIDHNLTAAQTIAVREWIYLAAHPGGGSYYLQLYTPSIGTSIGTDQLGNWLLSEDLGSSSTDHATTIATPVGAWTCLELVATRAGNAQRVQAYADGTLLVDFQPAQPYAFTDLFIGLARIPSGNAEELFLDDVAVAPQRIGCP